MKLSLPIVAVLCALAPPAQAQEVRVLGTFGKWVAHTYEEKGKPVCFMSAKPDTSEGNYKARGEVLLMITNRPGEQALDVISVVAGYQYLPDSDAVVTINGKRFSLFTNGERAWARDTQADKAIVQLLIKAKSVTVKSTSSRNNITTDNFSLTGFTAAHRAITQDCKKV
jgi:Invasion associated locus B (IalB) protein